MDWHRFPQNDPSDPSGVADLIRRADAALGDRPLTGTTFVHDVRTMLHHTRAIEQAVHGVDTTLYVGFQTASKLDSQVDTYRDLVGSGTSVVCFGVGQPESDTGVRWCQVPDDPLALEAQWFLVSEAPEPIAFVGFETSPEDLRASGGAGAPGKTWEGFVSGEKPLVDALLDYLSSVAAKATS